MANELKMRQLLFWDDLAELLDKGAKSLSNFSKRYLGGRAPFAHNYSSGNSQFIGDASALAAWIEWIETSAFENNSKIAILIWKNMDLLNFKMPLPLGQFMEHHNSWLAAHYEWRADNRGNYNFRSSTQFPAALENYVYNNHQKLARELNTSVLEVRTFLSLKGGGNGNV